MYIAMNRFSVRKGSEADFEAWWAAAMQGGRLYFDKGKRAAAP